MRRMLAVLMVATLAACGGDAEDVVADLGSLQLELISGADQVAEVVTTAGDQVAADATDGLLPDPIVVRVTDTEGNVLVGSSSMIAAPSLSVVGAGGPAPTEPASAITLPPNSLVRFVVPDSFGEPAIGYGLPDDTGYVRDRWVKGTKAGEACMDIRLLVGDSLVTTEAACNTFLPGPVARIDFTLSGFNHQITAGDTLNLMNYLAGPADGNGNAIPLDSIVDLVGWAQYNNDATGSSIPAPSGPEVMSPLVPIPADWCQPEECYGFGVMVWVDTVYGGGRILDVQRPQ